MVEPLVHEAADTVAMRRRQPSGGIRTYVRGVGELLITVGVVVLLFVGYELWFTGLYTKAQQRTLTKQLEQLWKQPSGSPAAIRQLRDPALGSGIAILRIPRLGRHYVFVIVQGTDFLQLQKGPGHYTQFGSVMPGQVGNFDVAGHRTTYLHPFYNIDRLRPNDRIYVETRDTWFVYRVQNIPGTTAKWQEIVSPNDVTVAYPVPDQGDLSKKPKLAALTFTSCNPRYYATQRIVIHGLLIDARPKSQGPPPALAG